METITCVNEEPGVAGVMSVAYDAQTEIYLSRGSGFWSARQAGRFCAEWQRIVRQAHAEGRSILMLIDMAECHVQKPEVAEIIANTTEGLYEAGDAIAMMVPTCLAKMQLRRTLDGRYHEFFLSPEAARTWLEGKRATARQRTLHLSAAS